MSTRLKVSIGQYSDKGCKSVNQDFHGACVPKEPQLGSKGVAIAIADGISSSDVSQIASQAAVTSLLDDFYCTSDAWSVKTSVERVLVATNSWLYAQTQQSQGRYDKDRAYACTLSAMVIKSTTAHLFHVGDTRIYQLHDTALEQLTTDHRVRVSSQQSYLNRALGIAGQLDIDYRAIQLEAGDIFVLASDGVYDYADARFISAAIQTHARDLNQAARMIVEEAFRRGSTDNLTVQCVRIEELPGPEASELVQQVQALPVPPLLDARMVFDGYRIIRELHASNRSHVYLAVDGETEAQVVIKTPSVDLQGDPAYLERFLMEDWIARRLNSAHVLKPCLQTRKRNYLYTVTEFVEGRTLAQWMIDHPAPDIETVRGIVDQIAKGLRAFHRLEMLHQDLRPANIMIDSTGTVKIIDFGSTKVAGLAEIGKPGGPEHLLGTAPYTAPEYFVGASGSPRSDLFSLGVIAYQMLTGKLPYGTEVAKARTKAAQAKLRYRSAVMEGRAIPAWIDGALQKALHPDPNRRYQDLSEFVFDLHRPNQEFLHGGRLPLIERSPVAFWKSVSFALALIIVMLLAAQATQH